MQLEPASPPSSSASPPPCPASSWASGLRRRLSLPWMALWADAAAAPASAADACKAAGVPFAEFVEARGADPAFRDLCRLHDEVIDLAIGDSLRRDAMGGEVRARSLYYHRARAILLDRGRDGTADATLAGERAEAVVLALLRADGALPPDPATPTPPSSRPRCHRFRKSRPKRPAPAE